MTWKHPVVAAAALMEAQFTLNAFISSHLICWWDNQPFLDLNFLKLFYYYYFLWLKKHGAYWFLISLLLLESLHSHCHPPGFTCKRAKTQTRNRVFWSLSLFKLNLKKGFARAKYALNYNLKLYCPLPLISITHQVMLNVYSFFRSALKILRILSHSNYSYHIIY